MMKSSLPYHTIKYPPIFTKNGERVYRLGEPGSGDPRKIAIQDYKTLRREYLAKKTLFRDAQFQPYNIKTKKGDVKWIRPIKMCDKPKFSSKKYTRFDVKQGSLGDCWFLCTLSNIAMKKSVICQVIPSGQSFAKNYAGIFRFRFWQYGKWIEIVVDDRLPTIDGNLYYVSSRSKDIFWSALLEKAYAKLYGGYKKIDGGCCDEALLDFTGGVCEYFHFKTLPDNLFSMLLKSYERNSLLCTGTPNEPESWAFTSNELEIKGDEDSDESLEQNEDDENDDDENDDDENEDDQNEDEGNEDDDNQDDESDDDEPDTDESDDDESKDEKDVPVKNKDEMDYIEEKSIASFWENDYEPGADLDSDDEAAMYADFESDDKDEDKDNDEDNDYQPAHSESLFDEGLVAGHAYSLTAIRNVTSTVDGKEKKVPLVRIRNPWGTKEWSGRWSDNSPEWKTVSEEEKAEINLLYKEDGEFWIHYDDFTKRFDEVYFCHWKYDHFVPKEETNNKSWEVRTFEGESTDLKGIDTVGELLVNSPQYILALVDPDEEDDDDLCTLIVSLQSKHNRMANEKTAIRFSIYKRGPNDPKPLTYDFFKSNQPVVTPVKYTKQRECSARYRLPPGMYYLIPNAINTEGNSKFLMRVFTEKQCALKIHDDKISTTEIDERVKDVMVKPPKFKYENMRWVELKDILNYSIDTHDEHGFSKDACRSMIAMQDKDYTGSIDKVEFKTLWDEICILKAIFNIYDAKNDGIIPMYNLQRALRSAGCIINERVYNILAQRYSISHDGSLILEDFLICALRLRRMFAIYKQKLEAGNIDSTTFTLDDWITDLIVY